MVAVAARDMSCLPTALVPISGTRVPHISISISISPVMPNERGSVWNSWQGVRGGDGLSAVSMVWLAHMLW
jgi:hypothetical protein